MQDLCLLGHSNYWQKYLITWVTKNKLPILKGEVKTCLEGLLRALIMKEPFIYFIDEYKVLETHVHLLLDVSPERNLTKVVYKIKRGTDIELRERFPQIVVGEKASVWSDSYYCRTMRVGEKDKKGDLQLY